MPKRKGEKDKGGDMPSTLARSDTHAREIWQKTHDSAVETYGEGERAHRTAFASLKHSYEKKGGKWVAKDEKGPSDPRAKKSAKDARKGKGETFGGIDYYGHTKGEFMERARKLDIPGRSKMSKKELAQAIAKRERSNEQRERRKAA